MSGSLTTFEQDSAIILIVSNSWVIGRNILDRNIITSSLQLIAYHKTMMKSILDRFMNMKQPRHQITDILATEVSDYKTLINQCIRLQNLNQPRYQVTELKTTKVSDYRT